MHASLDDAHGSAATVRSKNKTNREAQSMGRPVVLALSLSAREIAQ